MTYKFPKVMAVVVASATVLASCSSAEETTDNSGGGGKDDAALSFTDLAGRDVELDKAPERVLLVRDAPSLPPASSTPRIRWIRS